MAVRKQLKRTNLHARVAPGTGDKLKEIAQLLGYVYDREVLIGQLLDVIANGELILITTKKASNSQKSGEDINQKWFKIRVGTKCPQLSKKGGVY